LPKFESSSKESIEPNDRSILAESFRILRTNLQFKLSALTSTRRDIPTILVTSTVKGEGKTFVSYNLSLTLALTNKRVLLIGGDIRNPQIHRYLPNATKDQKGLTELLTNDDIRLDDIKVTHEKVSNLDIILSGAIPPNPAELLMSERMESVLDKASSVYDYIILDSAPTILVTDTLLISKYSDVTVYVTRANYTDKPLLSFIKENVERKKLNNVSLVLNDVKQSNFGYGSKYSYHYSSKPQGILAKIRRLFSSH
jgi:capsular exopolysaccharide synthesis family protein